MERNTRASRAACLCAALLFGASAHAVDGVIEINDASIAAAGGYPGVISAPGSYVLTGNLTPPPGIDAIDVIAPNVTLDLNGFQLSGAGGTGVNGTSAGLTVRNGSVTGFGVGVILGVSGKAIALHVNANTSGIASSAGCLVLQSTVTSKGVGIDVSRCKIENNVIEGNGLGISGMANLILHNQILGNGGGGILAPAGGVIQQNVLEDNGAFGINDGAPPPPVLPPPPGPPRRLQIIENGIQGTFFGPGISTDAL